MTQIHSRAKALLMLDELHRLGFEQLRFATPGGHRTHIYAARDEARPTETDARYVPAPRHFTTPLLGHEPAGTHHLASKWEQLFRSDLKPNHLAGVFLLDFPDIARNGFGPDEVYRNWFRTLRPQLQQGYLPETHPIDAFVQPHRELLWSFAPETISSYPGPPPNPHHSKINTAPRLVAKEDTLHHASLRALLMLHELHRFGFEQLRFHSYGGHGYAHIFAAQDEASADITDPRFIPAVRRFNTVIQIDGAPAQNDFLSSRWRELLASTMRPNHLAGLFILDFPDIARHGFGADEDYRHWFRALRTHLATGMLPVTHAHFSHAQPLRSLTWIDVRDQNQREIPYPGPPQNSYMLNLREFTP